MEHGEHKTMTIIAEKGNEHVCEIILTFDSPQPEKFDRSYVVYHVLTGEPQEDEEVEIHASAFIPSEGEGGDLMPIEDDEEWDMIEEIVGAFLDEEDEE